MEGANKNGAVVIRQIAIPMSIADFAIMGVLIKKPQENSPAKWATMAESIYEFDCAPKALSVL